MIALEFELSAESVTALLRAVAGGRATARPCRIVWHDTPEGALAGHDCALAETAEGWRLEQLWPGAAEWPPATPPPLLAESAALTGLAAELERLDVGSGLMPIAAFEGTRRTIRLPDAGEGASLMLLDGQLRSVATEQPATLCRLTGEAAAIQARAVKLSGQLRLTAPRASLAARGRALARGEAPPPRRLGAPGVAPGQTVGAALAQVTSWLIDVMLHWSALIPGPDSEQAVHQTRVAVRRLRSALALFARAAPEGGGRAALDQARQSLKDLAGQLGPARDWDVFLGDTGQALASGFAGEPRVAALLAAGERHRRAVHAALRAWQDSPAARRLEVEVACFAALRPWEAPPPEAVEPPDAGPVEEESAPPTPDPVPADLLDAPCREYARHMLTRRRKRMLRDGADIHTLPVPALHELRKDAKRLRYACEIFAPLFPGKAARRFLRHMEPLQEALGHMNDAAVAAGLIEQLGGRRGRAFAAGAVQGFVAGRTGGLRARIEDSWEAFRAAEPFWG